jgi:hypothetical protein
VGVLVDFGQVFVCGVDNSGSGGQGCGDIDADVELRVFAEGDCSFSTNVLSVFLVWKSELAPLPMFPSCPCTLFFIFQTTCSLVHEIRR